GHDRPASRSFGLRLHARAVEGRTVPEHLLPGLHGQGVRPQWRPAGPARRIPDRAPDHPLDDVSAAVSATAPQALPSQAPALVRRLGPYDAAAMVISNVIGGGIFFVPVIVASLTRSGWAMLGVWLLGGLLAFAGAMAYAELAALRPKAGGE